VGMNDAEGLIAALVFGTMIMLAWGEEIVAGLTGGFDHARAQAAAELRRGRQVIADNTRESVRRHLEEGANSSPLKSGWWWANAAVRSGRALRRGMRGLRDGATGANTRVLPSAGPLHRIFDAAVAGAGSRARQAHTAARARRATHPGAKARARDAGRGFTAWQRHRRHTRAGETVPSGVCDNCGAVTAITALAPVFRGAAEWLLCAGCRVIDAPDATGSPVLAAIPASPAAGQAGDAEDAGIYDIEVTDPPQVTGPAPSAVIEEMGDPMAGEIVRRTAQPVAALGAAALTHAHSGGTLTHGRYNQALLSVARGLEVLTMCISGMRDRLSGADVSRDQFNLVTDWMAAVEAARGRIEEILGKVNTRLDGVVEATEAAGGPEKTAAAAYLEVF